MIDTREYISNLDMPEKVALFKELYNEIAGYGIEGDTELAHVNTFEASLLKSLGGSGTINEITNLKEYFGGGSSQPPPPASQTVTQTSEFPTELRPFIEDVLGEARGEFGREKAEGFQPFPGPQIAGFTPEQQQAFATGRQQFTGLAGTPLGQAATYYAPALSSTALGTSEIGSEAIGRRMDPFLQNVVDIAKREAVRDEEAAVQGRAAQAVGAGSFGGTRQGLVEAEAERNLAERLSDIQAQGLSSAFQNAQRTAEEQRQREMAGGRQFAALGDITGTRARSDLAGLAGIGETQQQRRQQALDIAQREFEQERAFPSSALQRYQSIIRGFPLQETQQRFATQTTPTPSLAQTLVGGLGTAAGLYGAFGGFNAKGGGLVSLQAGGLPGAQFNPGTAGGHLTTPMPTADQYLNTENVMNALDRLRQRGASIRGLSIPQVPQTNLPAEIPSQALSGILPAAEGGLMSVVRRQTGMSITDPGDYAKGAFGPGGYSGLQARMQEREFDSSAFPGFTGTQKNRDDTLLTEEKKKEIVELKNKKDNTNDPQEINRLNRLIANLEAAIQGVGTAQGRYDELMGEKDRQYLEAIGRAPEYYKERQEDLSERRKKEQFGNIAQFFARLGTSTAPAAQVGGLQGLLGAGVAAGEQTVPDIIGTEEKYAEKIDEVKDKLYDSNIEYLSVSRDIAKEDFDRGTQKAKDSFEMARLAADLGVEIQEVENDRRAALNALDHSDSAEIRKLIAQNFDVAMTEEGVWMFGNQPMSAEQRLQMNDVETTAALILRQNGGDYANLRELIQPEVDAVLNNNYIFRKHRTGNIEEVEEVEETDVPFDPNAPSGDIVDQAIAGRGKGR